MNKNIRFDLAVEHKLRQEFFSLYMPMNIPINEIIDMFLEDENYGPITQDKKEMENKLRSWAALYIENHPKKRIPNYKELKSEMKKLLRQYGLDNDDAKGFFVSKLIVDGKSEEEAHQIANMIINDIIGGEKEL